MKKLTKGLIGLSVLLLGYHFVTSAIGEYIDIQLGSLYSKRYFAGLDAYISRHDPRVSVGYENYLNKSNLDEKYLRYGLLKRNLVKINPFIYDR